MAHENVWALVAEDADNVAKSDVEHRERLDAHVEQAAKDLDLVFGDQLGEGDEEADLEGRQAVVRHAVAVHGARRQSLLISFASQFRNRWRTGRGPCRAGRSLR